jgi:hypothetical protein
VKSEVVFEEAVLWRDVVVEEDKQLAACGGDRRVARSGGAALRLRDDFEGESGPQGRQHLARPIGGTVDGDHDLERRAKLAVSFQLAEETSEALAAVV